MKTILVVIIFIIIIVVGVALYFYLKNKKTTPTEQANPTNIVSIFKKSTWDNYLYSLNNIKQINMKFKIFKIEDLVLNEKTALFGNDNYGLPKFEISIYISQKTPKPLGVIEFTYNNRKNNNKIEYIFDYTGNVEMSIQLKFNNLNLEISHSYPSLNFVSPKRTYNLTSIYEKERFQYVSMGVRPGITTDHQQRYKEIEVLGLV